jgi:hypothetical protein
MDVSKELLIFKKGCDLKNDNKLAHLEGKNLKPLFVHHFTCHFSMIHVVDIINVL